MMQRLFGFMLFASVGFAQKEAPVQISVPLDDGKILITPQFIRVSEYGIYVPELNLRLENKTSNAWRNVELQIDVGGLCNGTSRHWTIPVITSLGQGFNGNPFVKDYKDYVIPLFGKVDGCKAEVFKASLISAENGKTRIDGVTGEQVDLERQRQELVAKREAEVAAQAERERKAAEAEAEEKRRAVEAQAKKDTAALKLFTNSIKLTSLRLPPRFAGNDIIQLFKAHEALRASEKSEYETSAQFKQRIAVAEAQFFSTTTLAFVVPVISAYDADERVLKAGVECAEPGVVYGRALTSIPVKSRRTVRTYEASNAFGAKTNVRETDVESYRIGINNPGDFGMAHTRGLPAAIMSSIKSSPDEARQIKVTLSALVICSISRGDDVTTDDSILAKATFDDPTEYFEQMHFLNTRLLAIWLFDASSGKVYSKVEHEVVQ